VSRPCVQGDGETVDIAAQLKGFNPKEIKTIASDIVKSGAALHDALGMEPELREHRARAIAGHVDQVWGGRKGG
jgi:clusterin-associated protein 1